MNSSCNSVLKQNFFECWPSWDKGEMLKAEGNTAEGREMTRAGTLNSQGGAG